MNESLDQHAGHRPAPSTGSRQVAQSWGSATSTISPSAVRNAPVTRANRRPGAKPASISPCMAGTVARPTVNLNHSRRDKDRRNQHIA
jgi:hypothetical protein